MQGAHFAEKQAASAGPTRHVAIFASYAPSLINFRGPMIRALLGAGHRVTVMAPDFDDPSRRALAGWGVRCIEVPLQRTGQNPLRDLQSCLVVFKHLRSMRPDHLITYTVKPNVWGGIAARLAGVRSAAMVTGLGFAFTDVQGWRKRLLRGLTVRLFQLSTGGNDVVVFQNPDDPVDFLAAKALKDPSKVRLINGSGVDLSHYAPVPLPEAPVFLMIARLLGNKGVREYGEAARRVKAIHPEARFLLVGGIDEGADAVREDEVETWIKGGIEYLGEQSDIRPAMAQCSVYVLPSYREGTPRSVLEAMAMGRSILTSDAPGCRETTQDGENGFLIPVRDIDALCERMCWMIENPSERARMGQSSLAMARDKYDVARVNAALFEHVGLSGFAQEDRAGASHGQ